MLNVSPKVAPARTRKDEAVCVAVPGRFEHVDRSQNIDLRVVYGISNGAPHIDLRREVKHVVRLERPHQVDNLWRGDIYLMEDNGPPPSGICQICQRSLNSDRR